MNLCRVLQLATHTTRHSWMGHSSFHRNEIETLEKLTKESNKKKIHDEMITRRNTSKIANLPIQ